MSLWFFNFVTNSSIRLTKVTITVGEVLIYTVYIPIGWHACTCTGNESGL